MALFTDLPEDQSGTINENGCRWSDHTRARVLFVTVKAWKVKDPVLVIALLTWAGLATRSALRSRKWQLIGMSWWYRSALCGHPLTACTFP